MGWQETQARLAASMPEKVIRFSAEDGDRVKVAYKGVEAFGVIGPRAYGWHTMKGLHNFPVVLDGTGQTVVVKADYLSLV